MLAKAMIKFSSLFRVEAELGLALRLVGTLPESHGNLSSFAGRKPANTTLLPAFWQRPQIRDVQEACLTAFGYFRRHCAW